MVYDITNKQSFESIRKWKEAVHANCKENIPIALVGNKCDLEGTR